MKKTVFLVSFILLANCFAYAQNKNDLVGTWYGKIRSNSSRPYGNAHCYTKRKIEGWQQRLTVDKELNYVYTEYYLGDTTRAHGHVDVSIDTIKFVVTQTNQPKVNSVFESSYFLYFLKNSELIYSNSMTRKIIKEQSTQENRFKPVEIEAAYSLGHDEFLKTLYASLTTQGFNSKDSVSRNLYKVRIDSVGNVDAGSLEPVNADPAYFNAIKQGLLNLRSKFIPAIQNGRAINGYFSFSITY